MLTHKYSHNSHAYALLPAFGFKGPLEAGTKDAEASFSHTHTQNKTHTNTHTNTHTTHMLTLAFQPLASKDPC